MKLNNQKYFQIFMGRFKKVSKRYNENHEFYIQRKTFEITEISRQSTSKIAERMSAAIELHISGDRFLEELE